MSKPNLTHWGGLATLLGGVLFIVSAIVHVFLEVRFGETQFGNSPQGHAVYHALDLPPYALLAAGIVGLHLWQGGRLGRLGKAGFYLGFIAFALTAILALGIVLVEGALGTAVPALDFIHFLVLPAALGSLLFGIAALRADLLPRGGASLLSIAALVLLGAILVDIQNPWLNSALLTLFGAGWSWLGYDLWSRRRDMLVHPQLTVR
jgi:hypothetical protein